MAERHETSPVGRYIAMAVGVPARLGLRPGVCFITMVVDSNDRRMAGRLNWGLPGEVGTLRWTSGPAGVRLDWDERGISVIGTSRGGPFPWIFPMRALQRRADGPVVVPFRTLGRARSARVAVHVQADDDLGWLAGDHGGIRINGLRLRINPARLPAGLVSSLRAPLRAPEPGAIAGHFVPFIPGNAPDPSRYDDPSRAYGSVG